MLNQLRPCCSSIEICISKKSGCHLGRRTTLMSKPMQKVRSRKFNDQILGDGECNLKKEEPYRGILGTGKTNERIKIAMWNVNGIRSVLNKKAFGQFVKQYVPDILCINETKINQEQFEKSPIEITGYNGYWNFCKCSAGYSGVAIFSKFLPLSIFEDLEEPAFSQEGRVLTLQYEHFYVVAVYVPSAGDKTLQRLEYKTQQYEKAFHKYCEKLKAKGKGVIICGDMNVCHEEIDIHMSPFAHKHPGFTDLQRKSFRNFLNLGWIDAFRKLNPTLRLYTWWRIEHGNRERNIGKRLDYFLINNDFFPVITRSQILGDVKGSDHCPIYLIMDLKKLKDIKKQQVIADKQQCSESNIEPVTNQLEKKQSQPSEKDKEKQEQNCSFEKRKEGEDTGKEQDKMEVDEEKLQANNLDCKSAE